MRQAHKEMNPAKAAALTTAFVWSNMIDAILVRAHADSGKELQVRTRITKSWLAKNQGNNETFGLLADISQRNYSTSFGTELVLI
jgi:hypothetical protein